VRRSRIATVIRAKFKCLSPPSIRRNGAQYFVIGIVSFMRAVPSKYPVPVPRVSSEIELLQHLLHRGGAPDYRASSARIGQTTRQIPRAVDAPARWHLRRTFNSFAITLRALARAAHAPDRSPNASPQAAGAPAAAREWSSAARAAYASRPDTLCGYGGLSFPDRHPLGRSRLGKAFACTIPDRG
jgi:hypothetical protein